MCFTEHQAMRSSHRQAADRAFTLVSHFAYDVLYNSISLLGRANHKQEQSKYIYRSQECREGEFNKPIVHGPIRAHKHIFSCSFSCIWIVHWVFIFLTYQKRLTWTFRWDYWQEMERLLSSSRHLLLSLVTFIWSLGLLRPSIYTPTPTHTNSECKSPTH